MRLIIYIYIIVLLVCSFVYPGQIILDSDDLKDITSRDSYDLLTKISTIHGLSYGIIGQPVEFERIGKDSKDISLYIDDIYYGKNIADLSFLSVDQVDRIVLDDRSIENSGTALHLYTKSFLIPVPTTEIKYRDAFFNYRNLSVDIFQNVTKDFSFLLSGEIFDWKDKREYSDNFAFPYQKQNYRLKFNFPVMKYTKPTLDISYIKEDKYLLDSDSIYSKPENLRSVLYFDNNLSNTLNNRLVFIHLYEHSRSTSNIFNVYDKISFQDSLRYFETVLGTNIYEENNLTYIKSNFSKKAFINTELNGFFGIDEDSDPKLSAHIDLDKDINSIFELSSSHGYFLDKTENQDPSMELFENSFSLNKDFHFSKWNIKLS
ncbi:MAG: hypothetical protein KKD38_10920, partial [Candidatus Delongbacteria bacterium]|nr:hypothetical protein [Candidatus Delongbacteria bacterium]